MAQITHTFVSPKADDVDTTVVRPSNWNEGHTGFEWYRTAADHTNSTVTPTDVTGLAFNIAVNEVVNFQCFLNHFAAALTTGIRVRITGPGTPTLVNFTLSSSSSASTMMSIGVAAYGTDMVSTGTASITLPSLALVNGFIVNGSTAGTVQIQVGSEIATSLVTVRRSAILQVYR